MKVRNAPGIICYIFNCLSKLTLHIYFHSDLIFDRAPVAVIRLFTVGYGLYLVH